MFDLLLRSDKAAIGDSAENKLVGVQYMKTFIIYVLRLLVVAGGG